MKCFVTHFEWAFCPAFTSLMQEALPGNKNLFLLSPIFQPWAMMLTVQADTQVRWSKMCDIVRLAISHVSNLKSVLEL